SMARYLRHHQGARLFADVVDGVAGVGCAAAEGFTHGFLEAGHAQRSVGTDRHSDEISDQLRIGSHQFPHPRAAARIFVCLLSALPSAGLRDRPRPLVMVMMSRISTAS